MDARQRFRFVEAMATDEEIVELAEAVFFSTDSEQARQLAAYVVSRLAPDHEIDAISAEISRILATMVCDGELLFQFPNSYRKPPEPQTEAPGEYVPHRTCRKCRQLKPLLSYGRTKGNNWKAKCLDCEARDDADQERRSRICKECEEPKPLEEFGRNMDGGRKYTCLECCREKVSRGQKRRHAEQRGEIAKPQNRAVTPPLVNKAAVAIEKKQAANPTFKVPKGSIPRFCSRGRLCVEYVNYDHPAPLAPGEFRRCKACRETRRGPQNSTSASAEDASLAAPGHSCE